MAKCLSLVAAVAFSLVAGVAGAQQCGDPADSTCGGTCQTGTVCGVSSAGLGCECTAAQTLFVKKLSIKLNFAKMDHDGVVLQGTLPVPAGFRPEGLVMVVDVGGVVRSFTLDAKGKGVSELDRTQLKTKFQDGEIPTQDAKYAVKFAKGTFSDRLVDENLTDRTVKEDPVSIKVDVHVGPAAYTATVAQEYTAKQGKTGKTK
jgi:hypothetical protein